MSRLRNSILVVALSSCGGAALAQDLHSAPARPDVGFFRPQSGDDASLVRTLPPQTYGEAPKSDAAPAVTYVPVPVPVPVPVASTPESQLDRSEAEAARTSAQLAAQPHINGAFTGSTDPRDR